MPDRTSDGRRISAVEVAEAATAQLARLTGRDADTVSSLQRTEDGWRVDIEVVELARVPATTSVMATYETELDDEGRLLSYQRTRRYYRNVADES